MFTRVLSIVMSIVTAMKNGMTIWVTRGGGGCDGFDDGGDAPRR